MMWLAVGAGVLAVWVGLGLFCAEAFMGGQGAGRARRKASALRIDRESHTPIPTARIAD